MTDTEVHGSLEPLGTFPPVTGLDWRNMRFGQPTPIHHAASELVYDIAWFIVKDAAAATEITTITFRVALSRMHDLPDPTAYTAWLAVIATNEAHRYLEESPNRRPSSALTPDGAERDSLFLADTLAEMRADHKLAMLLRYRYNTPPVAITMALDMRPRRLARLFVSAREEFAKHSSLPPATLGSATPPPSRQLPTVAEAYEKRELKPSVLGYPWLASGFPALPEREERRAKWLTAVATIILLTVLALLITRPWSVEGPKLIDPNASSELLITDV